MSDKLVTCIIPVFNHEKWVEEAIKSVSSQNYSNKRIIVVDDYSSDNSLKEVMSLLSEKRVIKEEDICVYSGFLFGTKSLVISLSKNSGPSVSRNVGIRAGWEGTDYFAFLDSDDTYEEGKISKSADILNSSQVIGEVYSDYTTKNIHTGFKQRQFKEPYSFSRLCQECIINNDSLMSKKALQEVGLYDEELRVCEDYDLHLRINERFLSVHIPENLVTIRVGNHSSTSNITKKTWQDCYKKVFEKAKKRNEK